MVDRSIQDLLLTIVFASGKESHEWRFSMQSDAFDNESATIETIAKNSDSASFARLLGLEITKAERGYALATLRISAEKHINFHGITHGAVLFAVADHACGICGNSLGRDAVLVHSSMNFFSNPQIGTLIEAEARVIQEDEANATLVIDVRTTEGKPLARCQSVVHFLN
jgi:acyl-CoA thioesterase